MHECDAAELKLLLVHAVGVCVHMCVLQISSLHMHDLKRKEMRDVVTM